MASSITTQADLLTYTSIADNELGRISTDRMNKDAFKRFHELAWDAVKALLLARKPAITEAQLTTPTQLAKCTCLMVLYLAYDSAELNDDSVKRRKTWWKRMRREFATKELTVDGETVAAEGYGSRRADRG